MIDRVLRDSTFTDSDSPPIYKIVILSESKDLLLLGIATSHPNLCTKFVLELILVSSLQKWLLEIPV